MELKIGVRAHDLAEKKSPEELATLVNQAHFHYVQLVFPKALADYSYDPAYVERVKEALAAKNIQVAMLGAYFNPVHSDPMVVSKGIANFKKNIEIAHYFGHPYIGSETGSYNDSPWTYVPKNHTEEAYQASKAVFSELASYAEQVGEDITIEPAWGHVIYSIEVLSRLLKELHSPRLHVTIDLFNLLYEGNFTKRDQIFVEALKTFGKEVKIIHLKDAKVVAGKLIQLTPGQGDFPYPLMLKSIAEYCPEATLVFEGVKADQIASAYSYVSNLLAH